MSTFSGSILVHDIVKGPDVIVRPHHTIMFIGTTETITIKADDVIKLFNDVKVLQGIVN